jgi:hypothetical protein
MKQRSGEARREYVKLCLLFETCIANGGADFLTCASATEQSGQALPHCDLKKSQRANGKGCRLLR